ncbi:MAG: nucleotidyl transferase AbiEii/AbiGii toxin family protein [Opitutales bacterium]
MSTEPQNHIVDINAWVERAKHDPQLYFERQATEIVLASIGGSSSFGGKMFLKGGTLMGVVYASPRQTVDIDFTANFDPTASLLKELQKDLNGEMKRAAARLGYPDVACQMQRLKKKPRPQGFEKKRFPAIEMRIGYARRNTRQHERLADGQAANTLKVEVSFKEPVEAVELVRLGEGSQIHVYAFAELISEKMRALLQQEKRGRTGRNRCQDVYDIAYLVRSGKLQEEERRYILERLVKKSRARDIDPDINSMSNPNIRARAKEGWETLLLELTELPDFDTEFDDVEAFYKSLPWSSLAS